MWLKRFEPEFEARFRLEYAARSIPFVRFSLPIAGALYLGYLFWDYYIAPDLLGYMLAARLTCVAIAAVVFGLTFHPSFIRWSQQILGVTATIGAAGILAVLYKLPDGFNYGTATLILVVMYACGLLRLLLVPAFITCLTVLILTNAAIYLAGNSGFVVFNANYVLVSAIIIGLSYTAVLEWMERRAFDFKLELKKEKKTSDSMLRNFLPERIVDRLKDGENSIAEAVGEATVLFADLVGFTSLTKRLAPGHLVEMLGDVFTIMDEIAEANGIEKVKTIGDNYMAVAGVRNPSPNSAEAVVEFAIEALGAVDRYASEHNLPLKMRVGIATGAVVSGVIGTKVPIFDLWGETVNLASRLESEGFDNTIQVSEATYWRLQGLYEFEDRGEVKLKGDITAKAYILKGRKLLATSSERHGADAARRPVLRSVD
jgi:class 3 adenylate cyclase